MIRLVCALWLLVGTGTNTAHANPDTIRVATYNIELTREGPGLALRDIQRGDDPQVRALIEVVSQVRPDILALQGIDYDVQLQTLTAFAEALGQAGLDYTHRIALDTNRGRRTGIDLDGDGRAGDASDAQGFGRFYGQGAMAVLSRFPVDTAGIQDFTQLLWRDLPFAQLPVTEAGTAFPSDAALKVQRLSSSGHWVLPVEVTPDMRLHLMTFHASPPVFDGPEDRNGRRNADEILLWDHLLSGRLQDPPDPPFVLAGSATLDPFDSDGRKAAIRTLLSHPSLQNTNPASNGARVAKDEGHIGDNALDTVDWPGVGRLRADYVLPSSDLRVTDSGVYWPAPQDPGHAAALAASRHRLVWVDVALPR